MVWGMYLLLPMLGGIGYRVYGYGVYMGCMLKELGNANGFSMVNGLCII